MVILSRDPDLSRIEKITDLYFPQYGLWVGEYPYLRRDVFRQVSSELGGVAKTKSPRRRPSQVKRRCPRN
jgi:hypothetical protein